MAYSFVKRISSAWRWFTTPHSRHDWHRRRHHEQAAQALQKLIPWQIKNIIREWKGFEYEQMWQLLTNDQLHPIFHYRHFTQAKSDGTRRDLHEPDPTLKKIQQTLLKRLLKKAPVHPAAMGYRRKKSTADHAWAHAGARTIITADIQDFFPKTRADRVQAWWRDYLYDYISEYYIRQITDDFAAASRLLTLLTTYRGGLPQGAPTSPMLSNVVNYEMDVRLERRVRLSGGFYTRYCDDLAFSWRGNDVVPSDFEPAVRGILAEYGYTLHRWQTWDAKDEPEITGIVLKRHGEVDLPDDIKRTMRQLERSRNLADQTRLAGYQAYEQMVKKPVRPSLRKATPSLKPNQRPTPTYVNDDDA